MESLPTELMLRIFDYVQELPALSALVHASPSFHEVYAAMRTEIFTAVTLRSLEARDILFTEPIGWAEVCLTAGKSAVLPRPGEADLLTSVLKKINLQIESKSRSRMVFSVNECLVLGKILHIVAYSVEKKRDDFSLAYTSISRPQYPFLTAPNLWKLWKLWKKNAAWEAKSARYPGGVRQYCLILVEDFLPE